MLSCNKSAYVFCIPLNYQTKMPQSVFQSSSDHDEEEFECRFIFNHTMQTVIELQRALWSCDEIDFWYSFLHCQHWHRMRKRNPTIWSCVLNCPLWCLCCRCFKTSKLQFILDRSLLILEASFQIWIQTVL